MADEFTAEDRKEADALAVEASNDLGCPDCDCDRPFKGVSYARNLVTGMVELRAWKLLGGWKGKYCPDCQKKYDRLEEERQKKLAEEKAARLKEIERVAKERQRQKAKEHLDFINALREASVKEKKKKK